MKRTEWIAIAFLAFLTLFTLALATPSAEGNPKEDPPDEVSAWVCTALLGTPLPEPTDPAPLGPTFTPLPSPTPTPQAARSGEDVGEVLTTVTPTQIPTATPTLTATPFPFDTRPDLPRYIYIDQKAQHLYVFEFGLLVRAIPCSTGLPDDDKYTPPWVGEVGEYWGTFFAYDVYADDAWYLFKSAGSILIHSLPYVYRNGYKVYLEREALGQRPASHGCIRIAPEDAAWLTQWNPQGVPVTITDPYLEEWRVRLATPSPTPTE